MKNQWWKSGFGFYVVLSLTKRMPQAWRGIAHIGGISTGTWVISPVAEDAKWAARVRRLLSMYGSASEFLVDE